MKEKLKLHFIIAGDIGKIIYIRKYLSNESKYSIGIAILNFLYFIQYSSLKKSIIFKENRINLVQCPNLK